jgi:hypothetical protein
MWRRIWAVVLIPAFAFGQTEYADTETSQQPQGNLSLSKKLPAYRQYTSYEELRQGTTEKVAIALAAEPGLITSLRQPVPGILPLKLEIQNAEGIIVSDFHYPRTVKRRVAFRPDPIPVALDELITFKVHADRNLSLGVHVLTGKLSFQVISDAGVSAPQEIAVQLPLTVVARNAKVQRKRLPSEGLSRAGLVLIIVLSPVIIALLIPIGIACGIAALTKHYCTD